MFLTGRSDDEMENGTHSSWAGERAGGGWRGQSRDVIRGGGDEAHTLLTKLGEIEILGSDKVWGVRAFGGRNGQSH